LNIPAGCPKQADLGQRCPSGISDDLTHHLARVQCHRVLWMCQNDVRCRDAA
jgi:hypothetical protein